MPRARQMLVASAVFAATLAPLGALAFRDGGGGSSDGDSYLNDLQRNPRFIEPGGFNDPARYRVGNPRAGYEDRQLSAQGYYNHGSGLPGRRQYRGETYVVPYYAQ